MNTRCEWHPECGCNETCADQDAAEQPLLIERVLTWGIYIASIAVVLGGAWWLAGWVL